MEKQEKQSKKSPTNDTGLKEASQPAKSTQPKQAVAESSTSAKGNNVAKTVALVVILALVALAGFFVIRYFLALKNPPVAVLEGETAMRMGQSQVLTFDSKDIKRGQTVCWYVNGKRVYCQKYDGRPLQYRYNASRVGIDHVRVDVDGKTYKWLNVSVGKSLATATANSYVITYGDKIPQLDYQVEGVDKAKLAGCSLYVEGEPTQVGVYPIKFDCDGCDECDVEVVEGTLEIVPRRLNVANSFSKVYDGNCQIDLDELELDGILPGNDVYSVQTTCYFADKNVGTGKVVVIPNVVLGGSDSHNYCVETQDLVGEITPKTVKIEGLCVANKNYDGTTKATLKSVGKLVGVVDGDVVALGNCSASFGDCKVGKNKPVCLSNLCLVGSDKDNYLLDTNLDCTANIEKSYVDLIINKPNVIHGQNQQD